MKSLKYILPIALVGVVALSSCDDLFEPANEMITNEDAMYNDPQLAVGLLGNAYILMPYSGEPGSDMATDDAVSASTGSTWYNMAAGTWSSQNDPMSQWQARNNAIQYCNMFLANVEQVVWSGDEALNAMFIDHMKGNGLGMRAVQRFYLLRAHAGKTANGELMGIPVVNEYQTGSSDFNVARNTFKESVEAIIADIDEAVSLLPDTYESITDASQIPSKYSALGATMAQYNRAFGDHQSGKVSGQILKALKAQVLLFAASPAYGTSTWDEAAKAAAEVVGSNSIVENGNQWYTKEAGVDGYTRGINLPEMIWMGNPGKNNDIEKNNFPPSLNGNGTVNPSQNLVDAFPAANGYPISDSRSNYDPSNPYENRDPRLTMYIVYDGAKLGVDDAPVVTGNYDENLASLNHENGRSTRTGYYMRKLTRSDVNLSSSSATTQNHFTARIRWTEIFLAYAEAANEAGGPTTAVSGTNKTAKSIIKDIRERAGICVGVTDPYLEECAASKDKMRELIRNERRLELCFENQRFYDLRRWNEPLNTAVKGVKIATKGKYEYFNVDARKYASYMNYGPIPYAEVRKYNNLEQNQGW